MFYLLSSDYVGPDKRDSHGNIRGDSEVMSICTEPGRTNQSREVRVEGWLGTTNDTSRRAHGEFVTVEEARAEAARLGFTAKPRNGWDECGREVWDEDVVEIWVRPEAAREQWDAGEWFSTTGSAGVASEYSITADSTDAQITAASELAYEQAVADDYEVHGIEDYMLELRAEHIADLL